MSPSLKYAATGGAVVAVTVGALWLILDPAGRSGVLLAGAIALPVQAVAFWGLHRFRGEPNAFLAAWIGGTFLRMAVVGVVAFVVIRSQMDGAVAMLLALAGFFFGLLLLEPLYFKDGSGTLTQAETAEA
ncbi:MAG: hypothetical protein HKO77_04870 [Gemmatimonadetes bacterium]|nr:hypothetical protein [Gemmatimonadota bacterium]NNL30331.1 hypothetical protein [Gemmatimonadota bacterium]